ncbi:XRE family transcriptional regulator, partial [Enterococcus faecalis]
TEINHQAPMKSTQKELHIHITTEELTEEEITQLEEEANRFLRFRKFEMTNS